MMRRSEFIRIIFYSIILFPIRSLLSFAEIDLRYQVGDIVPNGAHPVVSANLELNLEDVLLKTSLYRIHGEGHSHDVEITSLAWGELKKLGKVVVRSGPGGKDGHSHWVKVTGA